MPVTLTRFVFAGALAWAAGPAWGAGMPDYGTKNFSPGTATPSFFTNENSAVLGISANESSDDGADAPIQSAQSTFEPRQSDERVGHHRGKLVSSKRQAHASAHSRVQGHAARAAGSANARAASIGRFAKTRQSEHAASGKSSQRHAAARTSSRRG